LPSAKTIFDSAHCPGSSEAIDLHAALLSMPMSMGDVDVHVSVHED
jgi:hypothetical protein